MKYKDGQKAYLTPDSNSLQEFQRLYIIILSTNGISSIVTSAGKQWTRKLLTMIQS